MASHSSDQILIAEYSGTTFFDGFDFFTENDPTNGYVNYVDQISAQSDGLIDMHDKAVFIGCDHTNTASGRGRNSVRITSKQNFTGGLFIIDLVHMPSGCGTWPAFWTCGSSWPNNGEIDIIEGVNTQTDDISTLHTSAGCDMSKEDSSLFTGKWNSAGDKNFTDCYVHAPGMCC